MAGCPPAYALAKPASDRHGDGKGGPQVTDDKKTVVRRKHQLSLQNREALHMEGVVQVESFDNQEVVVETDAGMLLVRGEDLHIKELNLETGALQLTGV